MSNKPQQIIVFFFQQNFIVTIDKSRIIIFKINEGKTA